MGASKTSLTILCDLIILGGMLTALMVIKYVPNPTQRGFFCSDLSIRLPYHSSTVPTYVNVITSYGASILLILFTRRATKGGWLEKLGAVWSDVRCFLMGVLATQVISGVCKVLAGRLRPHFITVCNPSTLDESFCGPTYSPNYLTDFTCQGNTDLFPDTDKMEHRINEARLSFLSGHASLASYGMIFAILYITFNYRRKISPVLLTMFQVLFFVYMISVSISRVSDNKHHPTDVIAGMVLGSIIALVAFLGSRAVEEENEEADIKEMTPTLIPDS